MLAMRGALQSSLRRLSVSVSSTLNMLSTTVREPQIRVSARAISSYSQAGHIISGARCSNMSPLMTIRFLSISINHLGGSWANAAVRVALTVIV